MDRERVNSRGDRHLEKWGKKTEGENVRKGLYASLRDISDQSSRLEVIVFRGGGFMSTEKKQHCGEMLSKPRSRGVYYIKDSRGSLKTGWPFIGLVSRVVPKYVGSIMSCHPRIDLKSHLILFGGVING